ncbi:hypothetical protein AAHA92_21572 [Salvia divinorum]|uniref:Uncharacterized protein n=1 Tax=Salvia divinorum TaxID=28513 RepID=A0ABD1GKW2_SALDI
MLADMRFGISSLHFSNFSLCISQFCLRISQFAAGLLLCHRSPLLRRQSIAHRLPLLSRAARLLLRQQQLSIGLTGSYQASYIAKENKGRLPPFWDLFIKTHRLANSHEMCSQHAKEIEVDEFLKRRVQPLQQEIEELRELVKVLSQQVQDSRRSE